MYIPFTKDMNYEEEIPIIVGGSSGSGTRVLVWLLQGCGVYMGYDDYMRAVHEPCDSIPMASWIVHYNTKWLLGEEIDFAKMERGFYTSLDLHMAHKRDEKIWGWKNPQNMDLVNWYHYPFPKAKYIHVIRDGRDIAEYWMHVGMSGMYNKFIPDAMQENPDEVNFMWFWNRNNMRIISYCENELPEDQYMFLRLEDISVDPASYGEKVRKFIGAESFESHKVSPIYLPESVGRHKGIEKELLSYMTEAGKDALSFFGYITEVSDDESVD